MSDRARGELATVLYCAVGLVACGVLVLEISLTRVLSVLLRFHFVFLVISAAILGFGLGGMASLSSIRALRERVGDRRVLVALALAAAVSVPLALFLVFRTPLSQRIFHPLLVPAASIGPFFLCGAFISYAFDRAVKLAGKVYFADLLGAATGSLAVILVLNALGGINAALAASLFLVAGAAALALGSGCSGRIATAVVAVGCVAVLVANTGERVIGLSALDLSEADLSTGSVKPLFSPVELGSAELGSRIVATDWNAFARTDVVSNEGDPTLYVYTDGDVPTNMLHYDGTPESVRDAAEMIGFAGIVAGPRESVLFIGPGGGLDMHMGWQAGVERMVGVELNPSIPSLMYDFRDLNGGIYAMEGVSLYVDEGRSFIRRRGDRYDVIYTALTKTATTQASGLTLVESHVFTGEAFRDYLEHLTPGGRIVVVLDGETIVRRALLTAVQALIERGETTSEAMRHCALVALPRPDRSLQVLADIADEHNLDGAALRAGARGIATDSSLWWTGPYSHMLIVTKEPLDEAGARALRDVFTRPWLDLGDFRARARYDRFLGVVASELSDRIGEKGLSDEERARILETRAREMRGLETLYLPFEREKHEGLNMLASGSKSVAEYAESRPQALEPVRDDRPFFIALTRGLNPLLKRLTYIPVGAILLGLLIFGACVGRSALRGHARVGEHGAAFGYFALLGVGFMLLEVPLSQKLVLFLGYPTLTLSVVVFSLLLGGGLGSLWSQRRAEADLASTVRLAALVAAALGALHALAIPSLLTALQGLPVFARSLVAVALVIPLGMALGVPFPAGMRMASSVLPGLAPKLWGVNGILSTAGTVLAMLGGRYLGFTRTLLVGCGVYLLVTLLAPCLRARAEGEAGERASGTPTRGSDEATTA